MSEPVTGKRTEQEIRANLVEAFDAASAAMQTIIVDLRALGYDVWSDVVVNVSELIDTVEVGTGEGE